MKKQNNAVDLFWFDSKGGLTTKWFSQLHGHRAIESVFVMCHVRMWERMCEQTKRERESERDLTSGSLARLWRDHTSLWWLPPVFQPRCWTSKPQWHRGHLLRPPSVWFVSVSTNSPQECVVPCLFACEWVYSFCLVVESFATCLKLARPWWQSSCHW